MSNTIYVFCKLNNISFRIIDGNQLEEFEYRAFRILCYPKLEDIKRQVESVEKFKNENKLTEEQDIALEILIYYFNQKIKKLENDKFLVNIKLCKIMNRFYKNFLHYYRLASQGCLGEKLLILKAYKEEFEEVEFNIDAQIKKKVEYEETEEEREKVEKDLLFIACFYYQIIKNAKFQPHLYNTLKQIYSKFLFTSHIDICSINELMLEILQPEIIRAPSSKTPQSDPISSHSSSGTVKHKSMIFFSEAYKGGIPIFRSDLDAKVFDYILVEDKDGKLTSEIEFNGYKTPNYNRFTGLPSRTILVHAATTDLASSTLGGSASSRRPTTATAAATSALPAFTLGDSSSASTTSSTSALTSPFTFSSGLSGSAVSLISPPRADPKSLAVSGLITDERITDLNVYTIHTSSNSRFKDCDEMDTLDGVNVFTLKVSNETKEQYVDTFISGIKQRIDHLLTKTQNPITFIIRICYNTLLDRTKGGRKFTTSEVLLFAVKSEYDRLLLSSINTFKSSAIVKAQSILDIPDPVPGTGSLLETSDKVKNYILKKFFRYGFRFLYQKKIKKSKSIQKKIKKSKSIQKKIKKSKSIQKKIKKSKSIQKKIKKSKSIQKKNKK
jgi:hypothetical protein